MDEFLREIHFEVFKQWVISETSKQFKTYWNPLDGDEWIIETTNSYNKITFNKMSIIEFVVTNKINQRTEFYIHFQMHTLSHAINLYHEMLTCIQNIIETKKTKVLLCCSGGFTTGMFKEALTEAMEVLNLDYEFKAIGYTRLFEEGPNYDVILLAPQISYLHAKVIQTLKDPLIIKIPPKIFAKYDTTAFLQMMEKEIKEFQNKKLIKNQITLEIPNISHKVLCISVKRVKPPRMNINYKVFKGDQVVQENEIVKNTITEKDIYDVVEVMMAMHPDIEVVAISMLGIVREHGVYIPNAMFVNETFMLPLKERYNVKFILENDGNCAALGYYLTQGEYDSISLVTKTRIDKSGGVGNIINGKLIVGHQHMAGEVQFLPSEPNDFPATLEGFTEHLACYVQSIISIIAPQQIAVYSPLITDINDIIRIVEKRIPKRFMPSIVMVDDVREYATIGLLQLCIEALEEK